MSEKYNNSELMRMHCYIYPDIARTEVNIELSAQHIKEFVLPSIIPIKIAKDLPWNYAKVIRESN
jgi:hypothetical protein